MTAERRTEAGRPRAGGLAAGPDGRLRCGWALADPLYVRYHDEEWGRPVADDRRLFEKICLEGFQAGLSWLTILRKRDGFRRAFAGFDPAVVARFTGRDVSRLLRDPDIVRHCGKILATIENARRALDLVAEYGSLAAYVWQWEPRRSARPSGRSRGTRPAATPASTALACDLRRLGWRFVGPTTVYAFMQAMGLVNDHLDGCAVGAEVEAHRASFERPAPIAVPPGDRAHGAWPRGRPAPPGARPRRR